ncbi:hypothetical protein B0T26DRAFT_193174 [Lasiosphaeria miniovina]|uniref:Uncharacterized protein n=1 Tax=Lasiosphaeria miniovina TaxID=1954250 RepID=A0AA40ATN8_9PEZI|nr:uncharacterized protein B0T26DRAFT_193174 [Lasiosphaeria miniovina]KAK0721809.1 hypothetical protein B0T26DRAFT_193174 [Lasiosphaeria miniovina]
MQLTITLNTLQYGQSRDIYLRFDSALKEAVDYGFDAEVAPVVTAELEYQRFTPVIETICVLKSLLEPTTSMSATEIAYHVSRSVIMLSGLALPYLQQRRAQTGDNGCTGVFRCASSGAHRQSSG